MGYANIQSTSPGGKEIGIMQGIESVVGWRHWVDILLHIIEPAIVGMYAAILFGDKYDWGCPKATKRLDNATGKYVGQPLSVVACSVADTR